MNDERKNDSVMIHEDALLYRRLHSKTISRDGKVTLAAYIRRKPPPSVPDPEISVDLADLTTPEKTLAAVPTQLLGQFGLGVLRVRDITELGFTVRYAPTKGNIAHCVIEGAKTETDCQKLADITSVHTLPPPKAK